MNLHRSRDRRLREETVSTRLSGGLRAAVFPKRGLQRRMAAFATRYGSTDLVFSPGPGRPPEPTPAGIAHFLEHQLFKKQDVDVLMEFGRFGASSNAFTDYTSTTYYFAGTERFEDCLDLLIRLVLAPHFTADGVAKEKLIIEQELRMYDDQPDYRAYKNLMASLYVAHPVRQDIGGTVESIQAIDRDLLERCWRRFYHPSNLCFVASGDVDPAAVFERVDRAVAGLAAAGGGEIERSRPEEPASIGRDVVKDSAVVSRPKVLLGFKDLAIRPGDLVARDLEMSVLLDLLFGATSSFHARAFARGLIDDTFSASYASDEAYGFTLAGGESDEPERLADEVRREFRRARKSRFKKRDVERARRKRLGRYLRAFDNPEGTGFHLLGALMNDHDLFDYPAAISRITPRALSERLEGAVDPGRSVLSLVTPRT